MTSACTHAHTHAEPRDKRVQLISLFASPGSKLSMQWKRGQQRENLGILTSLPHRLEIGRSCGKMENGNELERCCAEEKSFTLMLKEKKKAHASERKQQLYCSAQHGFCFLQHAVARPRALTGQF